MKTGILPLTLIAAFLLAECAPATPANPTPTLLIPALPVTNLTATPSPLVANIAEKSFVI